MDPKIVQRRSNRAYLAGALWFAVTAATGARLAGSVPRFTHSPWVLVLLAPVALILYAPWMIWRYWRCAVCGAHLPAINAWTTRREWHCFKCHTPFDLS